MIRWITEYLGTAAWDEAKQSSGAYLLDVRELVDKEGNTAEAIKSKVDDGLLHLKESERVVVCCDYGMSRSAAIAAGILAKHEGISLEEAVRRVGASTGQLAIKVEVLSSVRRALGTKNYVKPNTQNKKQKILVTGASGFIGLSVVDQLRLRHEVVTATRSAIDLLRDAIPLDLLVKDHRVNMVLHLASPRIYTTNQSMGAALTMLKNVLDICVENNLRLVYLSGWEIYSGYKARELRANEELTPCPSSTYGQTKLLCENLIEHFRRHLGISCTILRSSPAYGPTGDRPKFIWNFLEKAFRNQEIVTHKYINGFPILDLIHVDDLCGAIVAAVDRPFEGAINIGTGIGTSTAEVAGKIVELVGSHSKVKHIELSGYAGNIIMDIERASTILGWSPKIELVKGLEGIAVVGRTKF